MQSRGQASFCSEPASFTHAERYIMTCARAVVHPSYPRCRGFLRALALLCLFSGMVALTRLSVATPASSDNEPPTAAVAPPAKSTSSAAMVRQLATYGKLPLSFEPNRGQTDQRVKFLSRGRGYSLFLTGNEAVLSLQKAAGVTSAGTRPDMVGRSASAGLKSGAPPLVDKAATDNGQRTTSFGCDW